MLYNLIVARDKKLKSRSARHFWTTKNAFTVNKKVARCLRFVKNNQKVNIGIAKNKHNKTTIAIDNNYP